MSNNLPNHFLFFSTNRKKTAPNEKKEVRHNSRTSLPNTHLMSSYFIIFLLLSPSLTMYTPLGRPSVDEPMNVPLTL